MTSDAANGNNPSSVTTLVDGSLFAIGGSISLDRDLSWGDGRRHGWLPVQCYAFRSGKTLVLVDTGMAVHEADIRAGLATLGKGCSERRLAVTRREYDSMLNMPWIIREFGVETVHFGGDISPLDFFDAIDEANAEAQVRAFADVTLDWVRPGSFIDAGKFRIDVLRPSIRVLATHWLYEVETRTLFSSDFLGFIPTDRPTGPVAAPLTADNCSVALIKDHIAAKFDWLRGANSAPIVKELEAVMADRPVERICPSYGCMIEGRRDVEAIWEMAIEATRRLCAEPRRSVMAGFAYPRTAAARGARASR